MDDQLNEYEKKELQEKFLRNAKAPIQEWIAEYLGKEVKEVFPDYEDESDVIGFQKDGKHYDMFLVTTDVDDAPLIEESMLEFDKLKRAIVMLHEAAGKVFFALVMFVNEKYADDVLCLCPRFDKEKMGYHLERINTKATRLQVAVRQRDQVMKYLSENPTMNEEEKKKMDELLGTIEEIMKTHTKEILDEEQAKCNEQNTRMKNFTMLCMALEEKDPDDKDLDVTFRRMPEFGLRFQDPEEETYVDKMKKEYDVKD